MNCDARAGFAALGYATPVGCDAVALARELANLREKIELHNRHVAYRLMTGRWPWQVKCAFCDSLAITCLAESVALDAPKVPSCRSHLQLARSLVTRH